MTHSLENSEYTFTDTYLDNQGRTLKARVVLKVNYNNKSYIVLPYGTTKNEFGFVSDSKNHHQLWKTIANLIKQAVDFGESLINPPTSVNTPLNIVD